jgi:hypothetical protein
MTPNKGVAPNASERRLLAIRRSLAARVGELERSAHLDGYHFS